MINEINIGDTVKSYDFPENLTLDPERAEKCYVEGKVINMGRFPEFPDCDRYKIFCTKRVFGGKIVDPEDQYFYPPVNGTPTWLGGVTDNVVKVEA